MSLYEILTFLHIVAVIIWLGAGFVIGLLVLGAARSGDRVREGGYHRDVGWLAPRLFIPASLSTFILGVLLVIEGSWSFEQLWITIAVCGWLISFLLGFFYFKPEGERIGALIAEHGPAHPEVDRRIHRLNVVDRVQLLILFLMVADMVLKPTGEDDAGVLVAGAVIIAAAVALALASIRGRTAASPAAG